MAWPQLRSRRLVPSLHGALGLAPLLLPLLLALSVGLGADCECQAPALCRPITHRPSPQLRGQWPLSPDAPSLVLKALREVTVE